MMPFLKTPITAIEQKLSELKGLDKQELAYRVFPYFMAEIMSKYFRIRIDGIENIPKQGSALVAPNHSGYSGFDAFLLNHQIHKLTGRQPKVLTHHLWFMTKTTAIPMQKMGFVEATKDKGRQVLDANELLVLFPEGEYGNFKPSTKRYHLQSFKRGFIRLALQTQTPVVPTLILGAEETHINLARLKLTKYLRGLVLPLPLNVIPLPAKWHILFLPPITFPYSADRANDSELVHELAMDVREAMQKRLSEEVQKRKNLYF